MEESNILLALYSKVPKTLRGFETVFKIYIFKNPKSVESKINMWVLRLTNFNFIMNQFLRLMFADFQG